MDKLLANTATLLFLRRKLAFSSKARTTLNNQRKRLTIEVNRLRGEINTLKVQVLGKIKENSGWVAVFANLDMAYIAPYIKPVCVKKRPGNFGNIKFQVFEKVEFCEELPDLSTPFWVDEAIFFLREIVTIQEKITLLSIQWDKIEANRISTTRQYNLLDKKIIPEIEENIKSIGGVLSSRAIENATIARLAKKKQNIQQERVS